MVPFLRQHLELGGPNAADKLSRAEKLASLAKSEVESDFPFVRSQVVVSMWALLESYVQAFLLGWLTHEPSAWQVDEVKKLRIPLGYWEESDTTQRCEYVLRALEQDIRSKNHPGISRFEALFRVFGLGGGVDDAVRKTLLELCEVRNVLVHRGGIADRRLAEACPWLNVQAGDHVVVTKLDVISYATGCSNYIGSLISRLQAYFGVGRS